MVTAISPIGGFISLAPIVPVSLPGLIGAAPLSALGVGLPNASAIVSLAGGAANVPLTYTATGTFHASLQITAADGTGGTPLTRRLRFDFELDVILELLIRREKATAGTTLASLPPDTIGTLADAITTDLLLASLGSSSGTTGELASLFLTNLLGGLDSPLTGNALGGNTLFGSPLTLSGTNTLNTVNTSNTVTTVTETATANLTLTVDTTALTAAATGTTAVPAAPTAVVVSVPPANTPVPIPVIAATPTETAGGLTAPAAGSVALAATTAVPATAEAAAATNAALQRFLTEAAARALDTVANNPSYAAAAASLYASVAVFRNPEVALTVDAVRQVGPAAAVQPLPSSVT